MLDQIARNLQTNLTWENIALIAAIIYSISLHEVGHAVAAYWCGDDTAKNDGRITFNPLKSISLMGSIIVPALLILFSNGILFGWAKPVTVLPDRLRPRVLGDMFVSMAGIIVNLTVAFLALVVYYLGVGEPQGFLAKLAILNVFLALVNLLPIPPLDGHHVFKYLLPGKLRQYYVKVGFVGVVILLALFFYVPGFQSEFMKAVQQVAGGLASAAKTVTGN